MSDAATRLRMAVVERVLNRRGRSSGDQRRAAFENDGVAEPVRALIQKVTLNAYKVTDEDVAGAKAAGTAEDEVFELSVCAALGQSTRQLTAALAALDAATKDAP